MFLSPRGRGVARLLLPLQLDLPLQRSLPPQRPWLLQRFRTAADLLFLATRTVVWARKLAPGARTFSQDPQSGPPELAPGA